ncbi:MAG: hypothetical protein NT109_09050 [Flavobacteriia bacterium]|nr:hypothetical protein [Flavobacteriia bacterium]
MVKDDKINYLNIGLMLVTMVLAYYFPFETFLLAYAFLGPLHYLTEISWLHDRQYFTKGKYDFIPLLLIGIALSYAAFAKDAGFDMEFYNTFVELGLFDKLLVLALFSSLLFAFVKNLPVKIFSILFLFIFISGWFSEDNKEMNQSSTTVFALTSLLPTLIHVYVFTGLFMLFGALKSRSKTGLMSVGAFIILPIILIFVIPVKPKTNYISAYGKEAYYADGDGFFSTNASILDHFNLIKSPVYTNKDFVAFVKKKDIKNELEKNNVITQANLNLLVDSLSKIPNKPYLINKQPLDSKFQVDNILLLFDQNGMLSEYQMKPIPAKLFTGFSLEKYASIIYNSTIGIMLMRFIAFAYMYHYLNWFSKTEVIRWHKVPKIRFAAVLLIWLAACGLYAYNYALGLSFLFFLSFTHVLLEFPLNMVSIVGIGKETMSIVKNGFRKSA